MSDERKAKPKRKKTGSKAPPAARRRKKVGASNASPGARRPPSDLLWIAGLVPAKQKVIGRRKHVGAEPPAVTASSMALPAHSRADETVAVDFELKLVNPAPNLAPALRVVAGGVSTSLPLRTSDREKWFGGISAPRNTRLQIFAVARVRKDGSITLSIREPGFSYPSIRVDPVDGLCGIGPLPYKVG